MTRTMPAARVRRTLRLSVLDGLLHAVVLGVTESWLGALAVQVGHGDRALALLVTVPMLVGAIAQLGAGSLTSLLGSRRRGVVAGVAVQAASHLGFWYVAWTGDGRLWPLLLCKCLFWASGQVVAPSWNSWMMDLTVGVRRTRWFAMRSTAAHVALLASFLTGGLVLQAAGEGALRAFAALYLAGLGARTLSAVTLALHEDVPAPAAPPVSAVAQIGQALSESRWRISALLAVLHLGAFVAVPFFTPHMLRGLRLDLFAFAWLTAVSILAKALAFPVWRRLADRFGQRAVLMAGVVLVGLVPLAWSPATTHLGVALAQGLGGVAWAAIELAGLQLLFASTPAACATEFFGIHGAVLGVGQLAGSLVGSALVEDLGMSYPAVFVVSALARLAALGVLLLPSPSPAVRAVPGRVLTRLLTVRPNAGAVGSPLEPRGGRRG